MSADTAARRLPRPARVLLVGAGYFAGFHLDAWSRMPAAVLAAVCDLDPERLAAARRRLPGLATYTSLDAALQAVEPDLVDIATPPDTHLELVRRCAPHCQAIICQKPLAADLDAARAVVEAADQAGVPLAVHENFRHQPWFREIRRLVDAGLPGRLHGITMRMRPGDGQGADAYLSRQPYFQRMPRFLVHETGIHFIDCFRYLAGEVHGVYASLRRLNPHIAGEDAGHVLLDMDDDVVALLDGNRLNDHAADDTRLTMGELWLEGERGVLRLDGHARLWWKPHGEAEREHAYEWPRRGFAGDCVLATQTHIVEALQAGREPDSSARRYLTNIVIEEAVYRSAAERRHVSLD